MKLLADPVLKIWDLYCGKVITFMGSTSSPDIEVQYGGLDRKNGYASVAALVARDPDNETFIFRRFDELGARNLLYLQTELLVIESKIKALDKAVLVSQDTDLQHAQKSWTEMLRQFDGGNGSEKTVERYQLVKELREKIKEYRKPVLGNSQDDH